MQYSTDFITLAPKAQDPDLSVERFFILLSYISVLPARSHTPSA